MQTRSVPSDRRRIVNSHWDVVPHQSRQELSCSEVNSGAVIFTVKTCSHYEQTFRMVSRYLVSMVNTCRPGILSMWDINIEIPPELYCPSPVLQNLFIVQHNCLASWNVFSSLVISLKTVAPIPSFVLLQDPPVWHTRLPSFGGLKRICPRNTQWGATKGFMLCSLQVITNLSYSSCVYWMP